MRLIDADALEKSLTEKGDDYKVSMFATSDDCNIARIVAFECAEEVKNAPTIEAEPVRHGRWYIPTGMMPAAHHGRHRCSVCGHMALYERPGKECLSAYCPNCFAKMNGGAEDGADA